MVTHILDDLEGIVQKISQKTGWDRAKIDEEIAKKQEEYGGLLKKSGAAYSIAKEQCGSGSFLDAIEGSVIFEARKRNDRLAHVLVDNCATFFGLGVSNLINLFNPEGFFVGGGLTRSWRVLSPMIRKKVSRFVAQKYSTSAIQRSQLRDNVGLYSAFAL